MTELQALAENLQPEEGISALFAAWLAAGAAAAGAPGAGSPSSLAHANANAVPNEEAFRLAAEEEARERARLREATAPVRGSSPEAAAVLAAGATAVVVSMPTAERLWSWLQALVPQVGDVVGFGRPDLSWPSFPHRFYNGFPNGRQITREEEFVDVDGNVRVLEVAIASFDRPPQQRRAGRRGARGLTAGAGAPEDVYVAIRFVSGHGTSLWTTWSKNTVQWMHLARDAGFDRQ